MLMPDSSATDPITDPILVADGLYKIRANSNCFVLLGAHEEDTVVIDTGDRTFHSGVGSALTSLVNPDHVRAVVLTHFHYDHIGNADLFPNATFYAGAQEIENYRRDPLGTILHPGIAELFARVVVPRLAPLSQPRFRNLVVLATPSHTSGAICLFDEQRKILFSGDTLFDHGRLGRVDLPTSVPDQTDATLKKIAALGYQTLCPGHDY